MTIQLMQRVKEQDTEPGVAPKRVVFVTGGMGGIGTAICRRLGGLGHTVIAGCLPEYDRKEEWLTAMRKEGLKAHAA